MKRYKSRNNRSSSLGTQIQDESVRPPFDYSSLGIAVKQLKTSEIIGQKHITGHTFRSPGSISQKIKY